MLGSFLIRFIQRRAESLPSPSSTVPGKDQVGFVEQPL
jgi:hypothetical protein